MKNSLPFLSIILLVGCTAEPEAADAPSAAPVSILLFGDTGYDYDWLDEDDYEDKFTGREFVIDELDDWLEDKRPIEPVHAYSREFERRSGRVRAAAK